MPNFKTHAVAGLSAGIIVTFLEYQKIKESDPNAKFDVSKMIYNMAAGMTGAILPDKIEPALHPNHRKFFHSVTAGGCIAYSPKLILDFLNHNPKLRYPAYAFLLGYGSHLLLDAQTAKSLPLIN